ncbi:MAG: ABC transporter ATP-binding protein [Kiloniellales bacterium]
MTELIARDVQKWLGGMHILKGASFSAERGSIVALLGASGSGKTTLLRCIAGLELPEIGFIQIGERVVLDHEKKVAVPPEHRNVGLVFQSYALWPHRTVKENVGYGLKLRGVDKAEAGKRVQTTLDHLGLGHLAERYPDQLSGGQQQRVAICRSLIYEPRVLLLDEPLSNLDAKLREEARYWIRKLILDLEICAILVTHDQAEALAASDYILLLRDGVIVQEGTPHEIYSKPNSFYSADFLGANNTARGRVENDGNGSARIFGESWSLEGIVLDGKGLSGAEGVAVIRVEQIAVHPNPSSGWIEMSLEDCIYLGDRWEYRLNRGDFKAKAHGAKRLPAGTVWCEIPRESVWIFPAP